MPKPDPALLDPARYPFVTEIETRFGDIDINRHVNNVAMSGLIEEGRVRFHRASGFHASLQGLGAMAVSIGIEFLGQAYYPASIAIHAGAARIGRASYDLEMLLVQEGRVVTFARCIMACTLNGASSPIPDAFRESAKAWMVKA